MWPSLPFIDQGGKRLTTWGGLPTRAFLSPLCAFAAPRHFACFPRVSACGRKSSRQRVSTFVSLYGLVHSMYRVLFFQFRFAVLILSVSPAYYVFSPKLSIEHVFGFLFSSSFRTLHFYMVPEREG